MHGPSLLLRVPVMYVHAPGLLFSVDRSFAVLWQERESPLRHLRGTMSVLHADIGM